VATVAVQLKPHTTSRGIATHIDEASATAAKATANAVPARGKTAFDDNFCMQRQARAPQTQPFGAEAFEAADTTVLLWLGMAGFLINSRGTTLMVDPLLGSFDMPVMIEFPIAAADVPKLNAVLITHSDNDHYSVPT
jgi:hypothetical protein